MKKCSTIDLREKEVINLCDGSRLGNASDFEFDVCDGKITALVISGDCGLFGFAKDDDTVIPWCKIECIGEDTVLVKLTPAEYDACRYPRKEKRKKGGRH